MLYVVKYLALIFISHHCSLYPALREKEIFNHLFDAWNLAGELTDLESTVRDILNWACFLEPSNLSSHLYNKYINGYDNEILSINYKNK